MIESGRHDVVCVSYLAPAHLLLVDEYPPANYGAEVVSTERGVAADGPMIALTLASMDLDVALITNSVGRGAAWASIADQLEMSAMAFIPSSAQRRDKSPEIVVVSDRLGNRTWFPYLPEVDTELRAADLSPLAGCRLAYVDHYEVIEDAATRAIREAADVGTPLFVNLGGVRPGGGLVDLLRRASPAVIQTNLRENQRVHALSLARELATHTLAGLVVVTMGFDGAVAISAANVLYDVPAYPISPRRLHGAGAAFSAGLIASLLTGVPTDEALAFASACGAHQCERPTQATWPSRDDIAAFVDAHPRLHIGTSEYPIEH